MTSPNMFICNWPTCGRSYTKASKLQEHFRSHTNTRPFICKEEGCGKAFLRKGHLQRHWLALHSSAPKPHKCSRCEKSFSLRHHLRRHEKTHDENRPFKCDFSECSESFYRKGQLRKHERSIHGMPNALDSIPSKKDRIYLCGVEDCNVTFEKWSLVVAHRREMHHNSAGIFNCGECGKSFSNSRNMQAHYRRVHSKVFPRKDGFICTFEECSGKILSSKNALKVHIATVHDNVRPYNCDICEKSFGHKHLLVRHKRVHDKSIIKGENGKETVMIMERPLLEQLTGIGKEAHFECPLGDCRRRFARDYDLDRHIEAMHPQIFENSHNDTFGNFDLAVNA